MKRCPVGPSTATHLARGAALALGILSAGCGSEPAELVRELDAARAECTAEKLRGSDEECVRMFERYGEIGARGMETYVGALRALDRALQRMPHPDLDTAELGRPLSARFGRGDRSVGAADPWNAPLLRGESLLDEQPFPPASPGSREGSRRDAFRARPSGPAPYSQGWPSRSRYAPWDDRRPGSPWLDPGWGVPYGPPPGPWGERYSPYFADPRHPGAYPGNAYPGFRDPPGYPAYPPYSPGDPYGPAGPYGPYGPYGAYGSPAPFDPYRSRGYPGVIPPSGWPGERRDPEVWRGGPSGAYDHRYPPLDPGYPEHPYPEPWRGWYPDEPEGFEPEEARRRGVPDAPPARPAPEEIRRPQRGVLLPPAERLRRPWIRDGG